LLHRFFEQQARRECDRVAVVDGVRTATYGELEILANRLAWHLAELGAGPEKRVGLCLDRTLDAVVGLLGILKSGAAYVPLDPAYPRHRLQTTLEDCAAELVVTERQAWRRSGLTGARPVDLDAEGEAIAARPPVPPPLAAGEQNLAYVIYTSGSTGRPKGVAIEHRSAVALLRWARGRFAAGELAAVLAATSFCFDLSVFEIFAPLSSGGAIVLARDVLQLPELPQAERVTLVSTVPSAMAELLRGCRLPRSVQTVNLAGEPLPASLVRRIFERSAVRRVYNLYGPSEDTTYSTICRLRRGDGNAPTLGQPLPGTRAHLLDAAFEPVPEGETGELFLGGDGLARGYLARPEVTAERFLPDPFSGRPGARLYRTGDLTRRPPGGDLEFHGRADLQVKIRGFRIELGEIEAALADHPAVAGATVVVSEAAGGPGGAGGARGDRRLVAYVEAVPGALAEAVELRAHLEQRLPPPMVPAAFVFLGALPRLPNGKLDRGALPKPAATRAGAALAVSFTPPQDACEALIAALWEDLTGIAPVGRDDPFVALGGHSLLAARVAARLRDTFQIELPPQVCLEAGTVAALAVEVERRRAEPLADPPLGGPERAERTEGAAGLPLSYAQQPLWLAHGLAPESPAYNVAEVMRLRGPLALPALERALDRIVERHEALRTTFVVRDGFPWQTIAARVKAPWLRLDLGGLPAARREAEALAALHAKALAPFDLAAGPVLRAAWVRLAPADHLLLIALHHVVADGWSLEVLFRELGALYAAFIQGTEPAVPELPVQYADFTLWQRRRLARPELRAAVDRWRERLAGGPPPLDLPTDRARPALPAQAGRRHRFAVPAATLESLCQLGRDAGATPFMVLLAAWQALLGSAAAQDDFAVGSPIAGRSHRQLEPLIGAFVNLLPLRACLSGRQPSGRELIRRVRETALAAYADQEVPFERLVEEIQPVRDPSRSPIFQNVLAFEEAALARGSWPGLEVTRSEVETGTAKFELTLFLQPEGGGLRGALEARSDLFDLATIERLAARFCRLLAAIAGEPDATVADLELLEAAEREQLLAGLAPTPVAGGDLRPVHLQVAAAAAAAPQRLAVADPCAPMSYGDLDRRAARLARRLRRLGAGPDTVIGVLAARSAAMVMAQLAVLKAGGAYLPLDPELPNERLRTMLRISRAALLVGHQDLLGRLGETLPAVALEDPALAEQPDDPGADLPPLLAQEQPEALAYVIFTSGSTGEPKGVAVSHRGLSHLVAWHRRAYGVGPEDRASLLAGLSFDASVWETWPYLTAGASLHPVPEEARLVPARLLGWLAASGITLAFLPTPVAEEALAEPLPAALCLRALLTGGDRLVRHGGRERSFPLVNHYGPTENSVVATSAEVATDDGTGLPPPIGRPIDRVRVYLLDAALRLVPFGVPGEVSLAGDGLARGYLGRPEATAEHFLPDPFGGPGARLYRTGDLARYRGDGQLQFLGRTDRQVKVRGLRIELGEVEACLARHPGIRQASAGTLADAAGEVRLVAWLTPWVAGSPADGELRTWLGERLPAPMIPSAFVRLAALPLTPNGKLDRRALPPPAPAAGELPGDAGEAPRGATEAMLADLWRELLGRRSVARGDDFFALGGHSLTAARMVARVNAACGVDLPLRALFEQPTLAALAQRVEAARAAAGSGGLPSLRALGRPARTDHAPLSLTQRGVWLVSRLHPGSGFYNIPSVLRLRGDLDRQALTAAISDLARRHAALRTSIGERADGQPEQVIAVPQEVPLPLVDLRQLPRGGRGQLCRRSIREQIAAPFDLARGPLLRALLLRVDEHEHVLVLSVHHLVADGWSMGLLHRELAAGYAARRQGEAARFAALTVQYADFARWQHRLAGEGRLAPQLSYWQQLLAAFPTRLELPADRPAPAHRRYRGGTVRALLPLPLSTALGERAARQGATRLMVLRAAFESLLGRMAGRERFVIGSPVAGRTRPELDALIGLLVNLLPIPCGLAGARSFGDLVAQVREAALAAYENQDVPFELLVEALHPVRESGRNPWFEILCAGNPPIPAPDLPGLAVTIDEVDTDTAKFDLSLFVDDHQDGPLALALEYDADRFDAATAWRLLGHLETLLAAGAADPCCALGDLPLLREAERRRLLWDWGEVAAAAPLDRTITELFLEQCAEHPDAVAVVAGEHRITYGELSHHANRLAGSLRRLGVGTDRAVGIVAERSLEMVTGLLGILAAGGAYVPLDPSQPAARIAAIVRGAGLAWIVGPRHTLAAMPEAPRRISYESVLAHGIEAAEAAAGSPRAEDPAPGAAAPDSLAYVLFTSGTTGGPKGVAVPHRAVVRLVRGAGLPGLAEAPVTLQYAPVAFDASTLEIWGPLLNGGRLVLPPPGRLSLDELGTQLERHGVSLLWLTAGLFHLMVDGQLDSLRGVRHLYAGGDVLSPPHVERALAALDATLVNGYGPAENTTFTTCHAMRGACRFSSTVPVGRPLAGTSVRVVDAALRLLPQGVPGELLTGGDGLARGYLGRPELTAERFVPDPFAATPGSRLYRTGDLARWLPDGTLEFLGRIDRQVKIRGFRVELGEIEATLGAHPRVRECAVVTRPLGGEPQLVAYLVPAAEEADLGELRAFLRERLPEPMLPAAFVSLAAMPLTPNGKLDRAALPAPELPREPPASIALSPVATVVGEVWAEILGLGDVAPDEDFFSLGGHSLKATQLLSRLRQVFGVAVPLSTFFHRPTTAGLVEALLADPARRDRIEEIAEILAGATAGDEAIETTDHPPLEARGDAC
jgi:amino acid adenylation domain-containing protein